MEIIQLRSDLRRVHLHETNQMMLQLFGVATAAEVEAAPAQHDVAGNVVGMELQPLLKDVPGHRVVAILAQDLGIRRKDGPLGIIPPPALELLDFAVWWHPGVCP